MHKIAREKRKRVRCEEVYFETYGRTPDAIAFCPYRISPLGAHIDHQWGKINGLAIDKGIHIAYSRKENGVIELQSLNFPKRAQFHVASIPDEKVGDWADHMRGAAKMLAEKYPLRMGISAVIGGIGDNVTVYLYQSVKEDDISLYGFASRDQKEMFLKLITVSGVGPKVAHTICASLSAEQIAAAVMSGNVTLLSSVKGLGKKTAEKIIVELKDKLKSQLGGAASVSSTPVAMAAASSGDTGIMQDAVGALLVLGYKDQEAADAVAGAYEDGIGLEDLIRKALKIASGKKFS